MTDHRILKDLITTHTCLRCGKRYRTHPNANTGYCDACEKIDFQETEEYG